MCCRDVARRGLRVLLGTAVLAAAGCATPTLGDWPVLSFGAWPVEPKNPTRWTFDIAKADARTLILAAFCPEGEQLWSAWKQPEEGDDILLRASLPLGLSWPRYLSPVYHTRRGPCPVLVRFRIHLSSPAPGETTVEVTPEGMRVIAGKTSGFMRVHGPVNIEKAVPSTTVEEYAILRRCGAAFGARDMPDLSRPAKGVEAIAAKLVDDEWDAKETLLLLGSPAVTPCLVAMLDRDGKGAVEAAEVLGRLRATAALPALERARRSHHWDVRMAAAEARDAMRGEEPSTDDLVTKLSSRAAIDRLDAAIALVSTGREVERARPVLEPFLESDISSERWRAAAALVRLRRLPAGP